MGLHVEIDKERQRVEFWGCVSSGCVRYEEGEHFAEAGIEDNTKSGLHMEIRVVIKKRERYADVIRDIMGGKMPRLKDEPQADEGELLDMLKFVAERVKRGYRYAGIKSEFTTSRGVRVYFRLRYDGKTDGAHITVELDAEKDGERLTYIAFGRTDSHTVLLEEAAKAINAYILFSNYVFQTSA